LDKDSALKLLCILFNNLFPCPFSLAGWIRDLGREEARAPSPFKTGDKGDEVKNLIRMNELKQPQARRVLPIISVVTFLGFLDTHLLIPIIALYAAELGASIGVIGLIIGLYSLTNTPANILFGRLIDRIGYKVPLIVGLIGDALSMFLYSVIRSPIHLALVRVLHGTAGALIGPTTMSVMTDYSGRKQKGRAMGFYGMAMASASLVG
jgi:predicted MFS family arabinose efflux permease